MSPTESVVLVHGLWMAGAVMKPLAHALERQGYVTRTPGYASTLRPLDEHADDLAGVVRAMDADTVHLVCHSLGGLLALRTVNRHPDLPPGRMVLLGTPLNGSAASRTFGAWPGGAWLLGESRPELDSGFTDAPPGRAVYMIAGTGALGLSGAVFHLDQPNDGTVAVSETRTDWLTEHATAPASHMGMLVSGPVHRQVAAFLAG